ncbi:hypothetical protein GCM10009616_15060 [Microlunatus lacustris]
MTAWLNLPAHYDEAFHEFAVVFVGGGNTYDLLDRICRAEVAAPPARFLEAGVVTTAEALARSLPGRVSVQPADSTRTGTTIPMTRGSGWYRWTYCRTSMRHG